MGIEEFTIYKDSKVDKFAEYLKDGKVMATRCKNCKNVFYPPRADCSSCYTSDVEWFELDRKGKLITFTVIHVAPKRYSTSTPLSSEFKPYAIGVVELKSGHRAMGWLAFEPSKIEVGMALLLSPKKLPDGKVTIFLEPV